MTAVGVMSTIRAPRTSSPTPTMRPSTIASLRSGEYRIVPSAASNDMGTSAGVDLCRVDAGGASIARGGAAGRLTTAFARGSDLNGGGDCAGAEAIAGGSVRVGGTARGGDAIAGGVASVGGAAARAAGSDRVAGGGSIRGGGDSTRAAGGAVDRPGACHLGR